ncbi:MAG: DUF1629 domain-containing protein [Myxococcaceae bacterium]
MLAKSARACLGAWRDATFRIEGRGAYADSLLNVESIRIVSARLGAALAEAEPKVELLRVPIIDKKTTEQVYFFANVLEHVDCLDREASGVKRMLGDEIARLERVVIDEARVPAERQLFRVARYSKAHVVRRSLAERLTGAGVTVGIRWTELGQEVE